ncbi:MAG: hypothetical protein AAFZ58_10015 [Pseudomonadota bacterium]
MNNSSILLRVTSVLWIVWGLVHMLAGVLTLNNATAQKFAGIADAVDPASLAMDYPAAVAAITNQHGFNLLWFGVVTLICGVLIWRGRWPAVWLAAIVGGLADLGYFLFLDLGGFVNFVPGTVMTLVSGSAIVLSVIAFMQQRRA